MARPLPTTFDKDSPMTPQSAGTNISYQTNVNRQKTKKWADAKPANYGGDDWGSEDEYDTPPPPSKPTGLRQQGQAIQSPQTTFVDNNKKYGELPPLPGASNPRGRANSFDEDDEKRNFSNTGARQPSPRKISPRRQSPRRTSPTRTANAPATRFSQITGVPTVRNASGPPVLSISTQQPPPQPPTGLRKPSVGISPISGSPHPDILQPGRVNTGDSNPIVSPQSDTRTPSATSDYQARRDFSPSAVPPPLATRASPAPQSATESPSARFPARKSSLSQVTGPEETTPRPWLAGRSASPGASARSPVSATSGKALPFIRPADIYRRVEEEKKEKERQSMESAGRPSMDSLVGGRPIDKPEPTAKPQLGEKSSSENLGTGTKRRTSLETDEVPDSGRRLMPSLQPVQERKSEYGFDQFNINDSSTQHDSSATITQTSTEPDSNQLDIEEARRQSVSPKLPDLNRISGFGMDIFTQAIPEDPVPKIPKEIDTTPTATSNAQLASISPEDMTLRNRPSFGFKSVVNQAFDRTDDSSIPNTPASQTGSGVKRTDSESTGTAGISPIISRVSSTANPDSRNRDLGTPSIPEAMNEPSSPKVSDKHLPKEDHQEYPPMPAFKQGHRRDISTPSPGNSPARTPDVAVANINPDEHYGIVADANPTVGSGPSSRPTGEREQSFRPVIPGGWTSYTNTDISEASTVSIEPQRQSTPPPQPVDNGDLDITPTTAKHPLPDTAQKAEIAGAAVLGTAGAGLVRQDSPARSDVRLPTPDLSMAPGGNLYSTSHPDPRLGPLPTLEKAPQETQLRPDVVNRPVSAASSAPPPPPPKDTPVVGTQDSEFEYFQKPTVPLKQRPLDKVDLDASLKPPQRPSILPTLSTDTGEYDQESDKLTKEIVKSLSPRTSDTHQDNTFPDSLDDDSAGGLGRESTYLPQEYDNYWASTAEEENPVPTENLTEHVEEPTQVTPTNAPFPSAAHASADPNVDNLSPRPLTPRKPEEAPNPAPLRPQLQNRFSWEKSTDDFSRQHGESTNPTQEMPAESLPGAAMSSDPTFTSSVIPTELPAHNEPPTPTELAANLAVAQADKTNTDKEIVRPEQHSNNHVGRDAAVLSGVAVALGSVTTAMDATPSQQAGRRLSLAEEKDPRVSSYPVSPSPPESEHPARSPKPYFPPEQQNFVPAPPSTVSPITSPIIPHTSLATNQAKLLSFKEIAALEYRQQRIQTFDETRHRFASMDTGLNNWMAQLQAQHPEHANATGSWGGSRTSYPSGSARSKFSKTAGGAPPQLQQPYYQQYLNASAPAVPSTPSSRVGPNAGPSMQQNSQQGMSPTANKLTSQQVQAKGKEFLHTAGVFGGKAGKAGKGLLAKGKNKLRGSSGGDKEIPPPPKSKADRRSSWGIPLSLSKSSGKTDESPRSTEENVAMPPPNSQRGRSGTLNSAAYTPPQMSASGSASRHSLDMRSGALLTGNAGMQQQPGSTAYQTTGSTRHEDEETDTLAPPAPLSKLQPSWDPVYAAPIAEEEVTQFPEPPRRAEASSESVPRRSQSGPIDTKTKSERSNSEDAKFYDAQEDPAETDKDWVMVEANPESRNSGIGASSTTTSNFEPIITSREVSAEEELHPEEEPQKSPDLPRPSIMERPRGSIEIPSTPDQVRTSIESSVLNRPRGSSHSISSPPLISSPLKVSLNAQPALVSPPVQQQQQQAPITGQYGTVQTRPLSSQVSQTEQEKSTSSSSFLPPIRRTSTFGLGFGSRHAKPRFPIDDDDDDDEEIPGTVAPSQPQAAPQTIPGAAIAAPVVLDTTRSATNASSQTASQEQRAPSQQAAGSYKPTPPPGPLPNQQRPVSNFFTNRPPLGQSGQPAQHQRGPSHPPPVFIPQGGVAALQRPEFTQSHVEWKPNRPKVVASTPQGSAAYWKEQDIPPPQNSWEPQHQRRNSNSAQRPEERPWLGSVPQPPSAANRYPELFRQDQAQSPHDAEFDKEIDEPPSHMYQAPIPRAAAFLPRQQGIEYQLAGVGPPTEEPRPSSSRRNSGLWKEIGGRLSRASSRERGNSVSRDGAPDRNLDSRGNEEAESIVTSDEDQNKQKRRSSFFGNLNRSSTAGMGPPQSRESTIAHNAGSRTDLLLSGQPSPVSQHDRKRSFFGGNSSPVESKKSNKLMRASTGGLSVQDESGKRKRFSTLSGLFKGSPAKDSPQQRPQATREVSYEERQPLESPQLGPKRPVSNLSQPAQHQDGLRSHSGQYLPVNSMGPPPGRQDQRPGSTQDQSFLHNRPVSGAEKRGPVPQNQFTGQQQSHLHVVNQEPTLPNVELISPMDSRRPGPINQPIQSQAARTQRNPEPEIIYEPPPGPPPSHFLRQTSSSPAANQRTPGHMDPPIDQRQNSTLRQVSNPSLVDYGRPAPVGEPKGSSYAERPQTGRRVSGNLPVNSLAPVAPEVQRPYQNRSSTNMSNQLNSRGQNYPNNDTGPPSNVRRQSENAPVVQNIVTRNQLQQRDTPSPGRGPQPDPRFLSINSSPAQTLKMTQSDARVNSSPASVQGSFGSKRSVLTKLTGSGTNEKSRPESKSRKQSGSGFMNGLIGRKSKDDRSSDDSRSQGSQPRSAPQQFIPPAQTYTDLQQQEPYIPPQQQEGPQQDLFVQPQERGRRASREPQYDSVPIPGGYSLVRGQGAIPVPTEYDPRGFNRLQQQSQRDPRILQQPQHGPPPNAGTPSQGQTHGYPAQQQRNDATRQTLNPDLFQQRQVSRSGPNLAAPETYSRDRSAPRRLSREDILARSPPKSPEGQQRPYQLTLPESSDDTPPPISKGIPDFPTPPKHDSIQRLQKPILRHPESPAGYPLPEDDVFSPVNDAAQDVPPPPPPKWPGEQQNLLHARHPSVSTVGQESALDRSNTHRTAVSAVSRLSGPQDSPRHSTGGAALSVPNQKDERPGHVSSPSPTPPSPLPGTPDRTVSPEREDSSQQGQGQIKTTVLETHHQNDNIYDASPRLPKPPNANGSGDKTLLKESDKENNYQNGHGHQPRLSVEEKIPYQQPRSTEGLAELDDQEPGAAMTATSYPGQEWNPYMLGNYDDGFE